MKRYILVLFVVFKLINFTYSQNVTSISLPNEIPTPNAQDLGLYGIIPMNYYTGRANISVPIFNAKENDIPLEIALLYDTGGILINRIPGWTGYNWSLQCGGCITRHKQGYRNDETEIPKSDGAIQVVIPYFKAPQKLSDAYIEYEKKQVDQSLSNEEKLYEEAKNAHEVVKLTVDGTHDLYDTAPDIFYFYFLGKSGQFFLGNDGEWKVLSDDNLKVEFDYENSSSYIFPFIEGFPDPHVTEKQPKTIKGFTLIDENGTKYIFGGTTDAIEYSMPFADTGYYRDTRNRARNIWSANSWYLTEVRDRFDNTIYQFFYDRGYFIVQILKNYYRQTVVSGSYFSEGGNELLPFNLTLNAPVYLKQIKICNGINIKFLQSDTCNIGAHDLYPQFYKENGVDLSKEASGHNGICYGYENLYHKLCSISGTNWMNQTTDFYYLQTKDESIRKYHNPVVNKLKDEDKGLDPINSMLIAPLHTIQILDGEKVLRSYNMEYQKYPRLMLQSLIIKDDINNTAIGKYHMKYQNLDKLPPDCTTTASDHWGYYSGRKGTNEYFGEQVWSLLCSDVNGLGKINYNNYKSPNLESTQYGMLSELIYPTGGKSVFKYEQNTYSKYGVPGTYDYNTQKIVRKMEDEKTDSITGGLRIKSITNYDDNNIELSHKEYQYSDGQLYGMPQYHWFYYPSYVKGTTTIDNTEFIDVYSSTSIVPIVNTTGTHIGYSKVIEKEQNGVSTEYYYTNFSDFGDEYFIFTLKPKGNGQTPYDVYSDKSYLRGKLYQEITKDANENPIKEQIITYDYQDDYRLYTLASNMSLISSVPRIGNDEEVGLSMPISGGIFKMYYPKVGISKSITIDYSQNGIIIKTTDYTNRNFSIKSNGMTANVYKTLSEKSTWTKQNNKTSAPTSIFATRANYYYPGLDSYNTKVEAKRFLNDYYIPLCKVQKYNDNVFTEEEETHFGIISANGKCHPVPTSITHKKGDNGEIYTLVQYLEYNQKGMLSLYQERKGPLTKIVWDKSVFNRCIGKISGPRSNEVVQTSDTNYTLDGTSIFHNPNINAILYQYTSNGNIKSITQGNGETEYYDYDALDRLIEVKNHLYQSVKKYKYNYLNK